MKILLVTHYYRPEIGAPQRRWDALVERFTAAGHQVAVLAPSPHYPSGRLTDDAQHLRPGAVARGRHGERIYRLRYREYDRSVGRRGQDQLLAAADAVATGTRAFTGRHRPDVIIATVPGLPTLAAGLALGTVLRRPVVVEMRDAWPDLLDARDSWDAPVGGTDRHRSSVTRWATALSSGITAAQRRAAAVVTTTDAFADVLRRRELHHVLTVRHGTTMLPAPDDAARTDGALRILYAGTIGRSQGLESAVEAAALCQARGTDVSLRIVGDGAQLAGLRALSERLSAPVTFLPPVATAQVEEHYAWADSFLVSLRSWEPLRWTVPSKLYDAMATGRHITAALSGEAAAIVERTGAGHIVQPEAPHALAALWTTLATQREQLSVGHSGRTWVSDNADDDALAERYLALIEEVSTRG